MNSAIQPVVVEDVQGDRRWMNIVSSSNTFKYYLVSTVSVSLSLLVTYFRYYY